MSRYDQNSDITIHGNTMEINTLETLRVNESVTQEDRIVDKHTRPDMRRIESWVPREHREEIKLYLSSYCEALDCDAPLPNIRFRPISSEQCKTPPISQAPQAGSSTSPAKAKNKRERKKAQSARARARKKACGLAKMTIVISGAHREIILARLAIIRTQFDAGFEPLFDACHMPPPKADADPPQPDPKTSRTLPPLPDFTGFEHRPPLSQEVDTSPLFEDIKAMERFCFCDKSG